MPKPFPVAFRRHALALIEEGRIVRDISASLGFAESCLDHWNRRHRVDQGLASGPSEADRGELAVAGQRIRDVEGEEVKILLEAPAVVEEAVPPREWFRQMAEQSAEEVRMRGAG
jgi:hypothetical protein